RRSRFAQPKSNHLYLSHSSRATARGGRPVFTGGVNLPERDVSVCECYQRQRRRPAESFQVSRRLDCLFAFADCTQLVRLSTFGKSLHWPIETFCDSTLCSVFVCIRHSGLSDCASGA